LVGGKMLISVLTALVIVLGTSVLYFVFVSKEKSKQVDESSSNNDSSNKNDNDNVVKSSDASNDDEDDAQKMLADYEKYVIEHTALQLTDEFLGEGIGGTGTKNLYIIICFVVSLFVRQTKTEKLCLVSTKKKKKTVNVGVWQNTTKVACKCLRAQCSQREINDFLSEIK
jgi:hypothetical protein